MRTTRLISLTNSCVAISALAFQVFVLYPWHHQLQHDFEDLKHEHMRVLKTLSASAASRVPASSRIAAAASAATASNEKQTQA